MKRLNYRRAIFLSIILISLGVVFNTVIKANTSAIGTVFIAVGGLFFIIGMANKKKEDHKEKTKE